MEKSLSHYGLYLLYEFFL